MASSPDVKVLDVLMNFDRRFLIGAAVALRSITENAVPPGPLRFTILSGDLKSEDIDRLRKSLPADGAFAQVIHRRIDPRDFGGLLRSKSVSHTAYGRLLAGDVLPASVERVVYVDADVLFMRNIWELAKLPLQGRVLAAVPNESLASQQENLDRIVITADGYFASGLMVIDLVQWRKEKIGARAMEFARKLGDRLVLHDQDALNGVIEGRFVPLSTCWGHWTVHGEPATRSVIHYAMTPKPWHSDYRGVYRQEFFECLDRTAFAGWRPVDALGLGRIISRALRKLPYPPTVLRMLRKGLRERLPGRRSHDAQ